MTVKKKSKYLKWICYVLFGVFLFGFQIAPQKTGFFSDVLYLLPFAVAVGCFEEVLPSCAVATVCGLFWDYASQRQFGFNALFLCVCCIAGYVVMKFYVRPVYVSAVIACVAAAFVYCLTDFFFFFSLKGYGSLGKLFSSKYVPMLFKTALFSAGIVYVVMKIYGMCPTKAKFDAE